jgi:hypothetical protein
VRVGWRPRPVPWLPVPRRDRADDKWGLTKLSKRLRSSSLTTRRSL